MKDHQIIPEMRYMPKPNGESTGAFDDSHIDEFRCTICGATGASAESINDRPCEPFSNRLAQASRYQ